MTRGVACLLAFGLLFPSGAAVAAPEDLAMGDDAVAVESVDAAPVEVAADSVATNASVSADSDVVEFKDAELKKCVARELQRSDPEGTRITKGNLKSLLKLSCNSQDIEDISPLQYATSLTELTMYYNRIVDVSPLADLIDLNYLYLQGNQIVDISALAELSNLRTLYLLNNQIVDVSPLAGLTNLWYVYLANNQIVDVSPLAGLTNSGTLMTLDNQEVSLADATSGTPFALPQVSHIDGTKIAVDIDSGQGEISANSVTWNLPNGGQGSLIWYQTFKSGGRPVVFSGTMTQNVLPSAPVVDPPIASATPTISGIAQVGETLTAIPGKWTDGASFAYQWNADDTPIAGATSSSFTLTAAQAAKAITVTVTGSKSGFTAVAETSEPTEAVAPGSLTGVTPTISGTARVGEKLTVSAGSWTPSPVTLSYQWLRNGAAIAGATNSEYTLLDADRGTKISVTVTGSKLGYTTASKTSAQTVTVVGPDLESSTPTISGTAQVGQTLTAVPGKWTEGTSFTYEWMVDGGLLDIDSSPSFTVPAWALGSTITVEVTGWKNGFTSVSKTSAPTAKVAAGKLTTAAPTISGTAKVGEKLTVNPGAWAPSPVAFTYEWLNDGIPISGATNSTYTLSKTDMGGEISVKVTGSKTGYTTVSETSAPTAMVVGMTLKAATPTISGAAKVGETLTAATGTWTTGTTFTYQWLADGKAIKNATKSTYTLKTAQQGKAITVTVTGSKAGYETLSTTSVATAKVAAGTLASATPTISGTVKVGSTLTAAPGTWTSGTTFTYQWLADGKAIKGATKSTYTLKDAELGKAITVKVTGSKTGYTTASTTSVATAKVAAGTLTTATPTITGTVKVGSTLTAVPGKWTSGTAFTYQWYSAGKVIKGATASTFVVTATQLGDPISVKVTGSKTGYTTASKASARTGAVAKGTLTAATPTISGTVKVGSTLTAAPGKWTTGTAFTYQWYASGKVIKNATKSTFLVTATQLGEQISVKVTGSKTGYTTASKASARTGAVAKGTLTAATPTITGTTNVGSTLTAKPGKWTTGTTFTYQWLADGKVIKNATKSTFTLTATQQGKAITVKVTGTKTGYTTVSKTSKATAKVAK
ncbi:MAG: leucine-rich repeat domain-containing protein [Ancrocorticia sp.]